MLHGDSMNKGLWFIELLDDDLTPGSATLSPVRGQFNDTASGWRGSKCGTLHINRLPPPAMAPGKP